MNVVYLHSCKGMKTATAKIKSACNCVCKMWLMCCNTFAVAPLPPSLHLPVSIYLSVYMYNYLYIYLHM